MNHIKARNAAITAGLALTMTLGSLPTAAIADVVKGSDTAQAQAAAQVNKVTINYHTGWSEVPMGLERGGQMLDPTKSPSAPEGKVFDGWYLDEGYTKKATSENVFDGVTSETQTVDVYAKWVDPKPEVTQAYVTYHYENGSSFDGGTIAAGGSFQAPTTPAEGETYEYYLDADFKTPATVDTALAAAKDVDGSYYVDVYVKAVKDAQPEVTKVEVTYHYVGGTTWDNTLNKGDELSTPVVPEGKVLDGFYADASYTTKVTADDVFKSATLENGVYTYDVYVKFNDVAPVAVGVTYLNADGSTIFGTGYNGTLADEATAVANGMKVPAGKKFVGWVEPETGKAITEESFNDFVKTDSSTGAKYVRLQASFEDVQTERVVLFTAFPGTLNGNVIVSASANADGSVADPGAPTREGYTFAGWSYDQAGTDKADLTKPLLFNGNQKSVTLYAQWTKDETPAKQTTEIVYNAGLTGVANSLYQKTFTEGDELDAVPDDWKAAAEAQGKVFVGWYFADGAEATAKNVFDYKGDNGYTIVTAKWADAEKPSTDVTVTYHIWDEWGITPHAVLKDGGDLVPLDFFGFKAPEGQKFEGWTLADGTAATPESVRAAAKDGKADVYAKFVDTNPKATTNVVYNVNLKGVPNPSYQVEFVEGAQLDDVPATWKDAAADQHKTFAGWFFEDGTEATAENVFERSQNGYVQLFAHWDDETHNSVLFVANGGVNFDGSQTMSIAAQRDNTVPKPQDPTREGYEFVGWSYDQAGTDMANLDEPLRFNGSDHVTLFAQWKVTTFSVRFWGFKPGATETAFDVTVDNYAEGDSVTAPANLEVPVGYHVSGWIVNGDLENVLPADLEGYTVSGNTDLQALFEKDETPAAKVTVIYEDDTHQPAQTWQQDFDGTLFDGNTLSAEGEQFDGWYTEDGKLVTPENAAVLANNGILKVTGRWSTTAQKYSVRFFGYKPGQQSAEIQFDVTQGNYAKGDSVATPDLAGMQVEGYTLTGWLDLNTWKEYDANLTGFTVSGDTQLQALYTKNETPAAKVQVEYLDAEGLIPAQIQDFDGTFLDGSAYNTADKAFAGWFYEDGTEATADNYDEHAVSSDNGDKVAVVWAKWQTTAQKYSVHYLATGDNDVIIFDMTVSGYAKGDGVAVPDLPARPGYVLVGWVDQNLNEYKADLSDFTVQGNTTLLAKYQKDPNYNMQAITVHYVDQEGNELLPSVDATLRLGSQFGSLIAPKSIEGYTYVGTTGTYGEYTESSQVTSVDGVENVYVTYKKDEVAATKQNVVVKYVDQDGNEIAPSKSQELEVGTAFGDVLSAPSIDGYDYVATYSDQLGELSGQSVVTDMKGEDLVVYVKYQKQGVPVAKTHKVTFVDKYNDTKSVVEVKDGEAVAKPSDPSYDNYTFAGWSSDAKTYVEYDFSTPVTEDITLYASYSKNADTKPAEPTAPENKQEETKKESEKESKALPQTGDVTPVAGIAGAGVLGALAAFVGAFLKRRQN